MERFPRGSIPPSMFRAVATIAPTAIAKPEEAAPVTDGAESADLSTTCPSCNTEMRPEHAHYRCPACGYRDSCCF
jgi:Zn finger protein HypA/HybF involved in hydrogenase expression